MRLNAATRLLSTAIDTPVAYKVEQFYYITLSAYPPASEGKKDILKVPYVKVEPAFAWDKGTEDEKVEPTMQMITVPKKLQGKGIGINLLTSTLKFMKKKRLAYLIFDNYNTGFWDMAKRKLPENVNFPKKFKKRIGV